MNRDFIPHELALALKELGFDEPCWAWWHIEDCDTRFCYSDQRSPIINSRETEIVGLPTHSQVFRWFREKYDLQYNIVWNKFYDKTPYQYEVRPTWRNEPLRPYGTSGMCKTYEEAEQACLDKLIEIIKNK